MSKSKKANKKATLKIKHKQISELYIPFPIGIRRDFDLIREFVKAKEKKLKPEYILWAVNGSMSKERLDPDDFNLYINVLSGKGTVRGKKFNTGQLTRDEQDSEFFTGVYFGWIN